MGQGRLHGDTCRQGTTLQRCISQAGKSVVLQVHQTGQESWQLRIFGRGDQTSEWLERFCSASEAMAVGLLAIGGDGIDEFYEDPRLQVR